MSQRSTAVRSRIGGMVEWLSQRIDEWGIDVYREDFGTPLPPDEGPERVGVAEMKQVEGFYKFWSE